LVFTNDLVLLATSQQVLQNALYRFSAACIQVGTKISPKKTDVLCLSRRQSSLQQVNGKTMQQVKYCTTVLCGVTSYESRNKEIDTRIPKANAILRKLCCSLVKTGAFKDHKGFSF